MSIMDTLQLTINIISDPVFWDDFWISAGEIVVLYYLGTFLYDFVVQRGKREKNKGTGY